MLSAGKGAQAGQTYQADFVPTTGREGTHRSMLSQSVTERTVRSLVDTGALRGGQQYDPFLKKFGSRLLRGEVSANLEEKLGTKSYLLDDRDLVWYTSMGKGKPV